MNDLVKLGERLKEMDISSSDFVNAETLISINDGVRVFNITSDGKVSSPSDSLQVHIVRLKDEPQYDGSAGKQSPTFLHVGNTLYPLIPGASPVLYSNIGAYIFPDLMAVQQGTSPRYFVALMFPEALPSEARQLFQDLLRSQATLLVQLQGHVAALTNPETKSKSEETPQEKHLKELSLAADKLSRGLFDAVVRIADEVEKGADIVKERVTEKTKKFQQKHKHNVEPQIQQGIIYAQEVADKAVKVSGFVVKKLGEMTAELGKDITVHEKRGMKIPHKGTSNVDEAGSSRGTSNVDETGSSRENDPVYAALDEAARTLERCLASGMEHVTRYKYGENPV